MFIHSFTWSVCHKTTALQTEITAIGPNTEAIIGSVVAVSVVLIIIITVVAVILCYVCRYLKREMEPPTMGEETITFGKIQE